MKPVRLEGALATSLLASCLAFGFIMLTSDDGEAGFDPESAEQTFVPKRIQNLGSPVYNGEAALLDATTDGVINEIGSTALDAETSVDAAGRG